MNIGQMLGIVADAEDHLRVLKEVNPCADFAQATEDLRQARMVAETWNGRREDLKLFFGILNRGKSAAQTASTNDVKRRFQEAGKSVFLRKEVRRAVISNADGLINTDGHHVARGFLFKAIKIAKKPNGVKEDVERELLLLVGEVEEPRTPAKIIMLGGATLRTASIRQKPAQVAGAKQPEKKPCSGQFLGDKLMMVRVSVRDGRNIMTRAELERQEADAAARRLTKANAGKKQAKDKDKGKGKRRAAA